MGLEQLLSGIGDLIAPLLSDLCDLEDVRYTNDSGDERIDSSATLIVRDVPCSWEAMAKKHQDLFPAGMISSSMTHFLTFKLDENTAKVHSNYIIRVHPRGVRGELVFEQPGRADYSFSSLVGVGATLRNQ